MKKCFAAQLLVVVFLCMHGLAQEAPRYNFAIGGGPTWPKSTTGDFANMSGNFVAGGGVNVAPDVGVDLEFMWNDLPPKSSVVALTGAPDGSARMYSVTGNLMLKSPEHHKGGLYGIAGFGWYHRSWELTRPALSVGTACLPSYAFWGVVCTNGLVESTAVLGSGSNDGYGWNAGGGVTYRLGESHAKLYGELRFHFAYFDTINTKVLPLTFGIRF